MSIADRKKGPRRIEDLIDGAARKTFRKQGFAEAAVLTKWPLIVGELLSTHCLPERMRFPRGKKIGATLSVRAEGAFALELQHLEPVILERINVFFGYRAVEKLRIIHGPLPKAPPRSKVLTEEKPLEEKDERRIQGMTKSIEDPKLREAVTNLGRSILRANSEENATEA
ncbi:MAG: DciA family protein [Sphingomonadales bacterium]|jgi:hypothetical protein